MKTKFTLFILLIALKINAQTITYANFSNALTGSFNAVLANQASFNSSLTTTTGNGVSWNATALTQQSGTPNLSFIYGNPAGTPYASTFPGSNYVLYDPALTSILTYDYINYSADSVVRIGQYEPSAAHEIYLNPDKNMVFPFAFNQSFTDTYAKNNYSDATTFSSFQTGSRTVTYIGYGTLALPQATFTNVALISELRTNSLGPDSYTYTWYEVSSGKQLLFFSENNGNVNVAYTTDLNTGIKDNKSVLTTIVFPNPVENVLYLHTNNLVFKVKIINTQGQIQHVELNQGSMNIADLASGIYLLEFYDEHNIRNTARFIKGK